MQRVQQQYQRACHSLAGGVSSSTRKNQALGHAMYFARARGCRLWDLDGREYIDLCASHGAALLGHNHPRVRTAVLEALARGAPCSYENEQHAALAELLCRTVPCCELVRFTGSGTEATMHCLRLARAYTGRSKILKFAGHFHGYHDQVMYALGGSAAAERAEPPTGPFLPPRAASSGLPPGLDEHLVVIPFNQPEALEAACQRYGRELAAVICEPIWYNAGCIQPTAEMARALAELPRAHGALLIFDEVLSAFRMCPGGAQQYLNVVPDLCTLGKAVGGGYPLSVFGGRREIMQRLMPEGDCQHSGTYNGHPVVVAAGLAAVQCYLERGFYEHITQVGTRLISGLNELFKRHGVPGHVQGLGARFGLYFDLPRPPLTHQDLVAHNRTLMLRFVASALRHGVYLHDYGGGPCHHGFCAAMTMADAGEVLRRLDAAIGELARDEISP
jgi:glutamate-1-semialdehyde 2,1-aminomutase